MTKGTKLGAKAREPQAVVFTLVITTIEDANDQVVIDDIARSVARSLNLSYAERASLFHQNRRLHYEDVDGRVSRHVPATWGEPVVKVKGPAKKKPRPPAAPQVRPSKKVRP